MEALYLVLSFANKFMTFVEKGLAFTATKSESDTHKADKEMLDSLKNVKPKNFREKIDKLVTRSAIVTKYQLGLSVKQKKLLNKLFFSII